MGGGRERAPSWNPIRALVARSHEFCHPLLPPTSNLQPTRPHAAQWPKVLQSLPVLGLSVAGCWSWAAADWRRAVGLGLLPAGRQPRSPSGRQGSGPAPRQARASSIRRGGDGPSPPRRPGLGLPKPGIWPATAPALPPLICHWALMTAVAALAMHVNVATRFLSSAPPLHWYVAAWLQREGPARYLLWGWALLFIGLGTLMLPNFYPWT